VSEGATTVLYDLDEALIGFGAALEARDYEGAAALLEPLALTPETGGRPGPSAALPVAGSAGGDIGGPAGDAAGAGLAPRQRMRQRVRVGACGCNTRTRTLKQLPPQPLPPLLPPLMPEAQWRQLADAALAAGQAQVSERCYAALGDASKTSFLRRVGT
jgi:hypothetical protein